MLEAWSCMLRVVDAAPAAGSATAMVVPSWLSRLVIVAISTRSGTLARCNGSAVSSAAVISGRAAFLAPLI